MLFLKFMGAPITSAKKGWEMGLAYMLKATRQVEEYNNEMGSSVDFR